jgi:hypothetical protein
VSRGPGPLPRRGIHSRDLTGADGPRRELTACLRTAGHGEPRSSIGGGPPPDLIDGGSRLARVKLARGRHWRARVRVWRADAMCQIAKRVLARSGQVANIEPVMIPRSTVHDQRTTDRWRDGFSRGSGRVRPGPKMQACRGHTALVGAVLRSSYLGAGDTDPSTGPCRSASVLSPRTSTRRQISGLTARSMTRSW